MILVQHLVKNGNLLDLGGVVLLTDASLALYPNAGVLLVRNAFIELASIALQEVFEVLELASGQSLRGFGSVKRCPKEP